MENIATSNIIAQTLPDQAGKARVDLVKSDFDVIISQKGYDVYHDKCYKCPCANEPNGHAQSSCRNCGGSGYIFVNRTETKMVIQSMTLDTKFKSWSKELMGTARITAFNEQELAYMDRITVRNAEMISNEVLHFKLDISGGGAGILRAYCRFNIIGIDAIYLFKSPTEKLQVLTTDDFTIIDGQWIELGSEFVGLENSTITIRYTHHPQYHILELTRNTIESYVLKKTDNLNRDESDKFPVSAVGRLANFVLDQENYGLDYLFNNSTDLKCDDMNILCNVTNGTTITLYSIPEVKTGLKDYDGRDIYVQGVEQVNSFQMITHTLNASIVYRYVDSKISYKHNDGQEEVIEISGNNFRRQDNMLVHPLNNQTQIHGSMFWFLYYTKL